MLPAVPARAYRTLQHAYRAPECSNSVLYLEIPTMPHVWGGDGLREFTVRVRDFPHAVSMLLARVQEPEVSPAGGRADPADVVERCQIIASNARPIAMTLVPMTNRTRSR